MDKKKKQKDHFPLRLNLLFFSIFILFSILVLRLGFVQIVYGENFKRELERTEDVTIQNPVPRGKMLDRNLKVIVDNVPKSAITYTNMGTSQKEMLKTAGKLAKLIEKETKKVTIRDKKDHWMIKYPKQAAAKITKAEMDLFKEEELTDKDLYKRKLDRITEKDLSQLTLEDLEIRAIFQEFNSGYKFTPQIVKNENVTDQEYARVSENLQSLPGVDTTTDWERSYAFDHTLKSILGNVTKSDEGLPAERLDHFLSLGYNRNDRVGKSQLELQYEDVLHGHKSKVKTITDKTGNVVETKVVSDGKRGNDLVLTVDMELQMAVEKIIEEELWGLKRLPRTDLLDRAYVVLMNPNNGEVLAMAGKRIVKDEKNGKLEMLDDALGTITTTYNVGSTVKGATILTGYQTGAISPGTIFDDRAIQVKGSPVKKSYAYLGVLTDLDALKKSSNVYMFHTAIRIGKGHYQYMQPLKLAPNSFEIIRNSFASFGLGTRTGIDLPNESVGLKGTSKLPGHLMDLVIGQYDTYSAMQLAQYTSTLANGGNRMKAHLVKEIREPAEVTTDITGPIFQEIKPVVLNTIDAKPEWIERVQLGYKKVYQEPGGTAYRQFFGVNYLPAGKTGTAQAFYDGPDRWKFGKEPPAVMNSTLLTYAPTTSPEVAMALIVPWAYRGTVDNGANFKIGRRVMDKYFELKNKN